MKSNQIPLIIGFVSELMAQTRIEQAAHGAGFQMHWIESQEQIAPGVPEHPTPQRAEHLHGPGYYLLEEITRLQPALLLFDLGNQQVPWRAWIGMLRAVAATRRIPLICFSSHMDVESFQAAKQAGAQAVLARSAFFGDVAGILQKYAQVPDWGALAPFCQQPLPAIARKGLELFNTGEYFEAHEELEAAWMEETGPGRMLYQGILQVAVAYLQIERGNYEGAMKLFLRSRQWLSALPDTCQGVDVRQLRQDAGEVEQALKEEGLEAARKRFKRVEFQIS